MWIFVCFLLSRTLSGAVTDDTDNKPSRNGRKARRDEYDDLVRWIPGNVVTTHMDIYDWPTVYNANSLSFDTTVFTS